MSIKNDFFEDLAVTLDLWATDSTNVLTNENADSTGVNKLKSFEKLRVAFNQAEVDSDHVRQVISEIITGVLVSVLTTIDGGSKLAEKELIKLVDQKGQSLSDDLHNEFVLYLIETGRFKLD